MMRTPRSSVCRCLAFWLLIQISDSRICIRYDSISSPPTALPVLTDDDRTYIANNFYILAELCLGRTGTPAE